MIQFIKNLFKSKQQEDSKPKLMQNKDPKDYTKCKLSTGWAADHTHCKHCMKSTGFNEFMSDICNGCGSFKTQVSDGRSYRKIYIDGKWKYQIRYRNGDEEIRDNWY